MAKGINKLCQLEPNTKKEAYTDKVPNSAEMALQLNDPTYYFQIVPQAGQAVPKASPRRLYIKDDGSGKPSPLSNVESAKEQFTLISRRPAGYNKGKKPSRNIPVTPVAPIIPVQLTIPSNPIRYTSFELSQLVQQIPSISRLRTLDTSIRAEARSTAVSESSSSSSSESEDPQFTLSVYPDYRRAPPQRSDTNSNVYDREDYIPTQNRYFFDLIFNIRRIKTSAYRLRELCIYIPIASEADEWLLDEPLLTQDYTGPGVSMLANQRFIPLLNITSGEMQVRIVPRSSNDEADVAMDDKKTVEVGVRLAQANVDEKVRIKSMVKVDEGAREVKRGVVKVELQETYTSGDGTVSVWSNVTVLKNDTWDLRYERVEDFE